MRKVKSHGMAALTAVALTGVTAALAWATMREPAPQELSRLTALTGAPRDIVATLHLQIAAQSGHVQAMRSLGLALLARNDAANNAKAREWLQRAADEHDAKAQLALGKLLVRGAMGVPQDAVAAQGYLLAAAKGGQPAAAHHLALLFNSGGAGLPRNSAAALYWLRMAADANIADSQFLLGQILMNDAASGAESAEARQWFERAAEHEHPEAAMQLAMAYERGELGVQQNPAEAAQWRKEAEHALRHRPPSP